jgi:hypothetical protein
VNRLNHVSVSFAMVSARGLQLSRATGEPLQFGKLGHVKGYIANSFGW